MKDKDFDLEKLDVEIESIIDIGLQKREGFFTYLIRVFKELKFKNIFHDKYEILFILAISIIAICFFTLNMAEYNTIEIYKFIFLSSPIVYLLTTGFSYYNTKDSGMFEFEMTCKYNLFQISAIRMFIFSIVSAIINTTVILLAYLYNNNIEIVRLIAISITGLFLFSILLLFSLVKVKGTLLKYFVIAGWIVINYFLGNSNNNIYIYFLNKVPIYVHLIITGISITLYIKSLNKLVNLKREKKEV